MCWKSSVRWRTSYKASFDQVLPKEDPQRIELRDQERKWLKERDYTCKINGDTIDDGCLVEKTAKRADELERRAKF